jgi:hypothetical protein
MRRILAVFTLVMACHPLSPSDGDLCRDAADHLNECAGAPLVEPPPSCDTDEARRILASRCEELGKADWGGDLWAWIRAPGHNGWTVAISLLENPSATTWCGPELLGPCHDGAIPECWLTFKGTFDGETDCEGIDRVEQLRISMMTERLWPPPSEVNVEAHAVAVCPAKVPEWPYRGEQICQDPDRWQASREVIEQTIALDPGEFYAEGHVLELHATCSYATGQCVQSDATWF